jgi:hypothetical protein
MLYQDKVLGRRGAWRRMLAEMTAKLSRRHVADLDLLAMNPHLRRDLGLEDGQTGLRVDDTRR